MVWKEHWETETITEESVRKMVNRELRTYRFKATLAALESKFGSVKELKTIELGAGKGEFSLLLALAGANVTLYDKEKKAFDLDRHQFSIYGLTPRTIKGDLLNPRDNLLGKYDVAISWGVVEHFPRPIAFEACLGHRRVIHEKGLVVICVPNAWSIPYRLNKWFQEVNGTWKWGLELPYSPIELRSVGHRMGLKNVWIHWSSVMRDLDQFLFHPVMGRIEKYFGITTERRTPLDRLFGQAITMFGEV
jgi:2-polyprenyl-3-methyl-5-hydroxy-6-metoxy-1,4-benzoquinol methylase